MKYYWQTNISKSRLRQEIAQKAKSKGLYYKYSLQQIILRRDFLLFDCVPVNFQPSFLINVRHLSNGMLHLKGSFGIPRFYYLVVFLVFTLLVLFTNQLFIKKPALFFLLITVFGLLLILQKVVFLFLFRKSNDNFALEINSIILSIIH